jgi:hypothetical protein
MVLLYRAHLCYLTELFYLLVYGMVLLYRAHLCWQIERSLGNLSEVHCRGSISNYKINLVDLRIAYHQRERERGGAAPLHTSLYYSF